MGKAFAALRQITSPKNIFDTHCRAMVFGAADNEHVFDCYAFCVYFLEDHKSCLKSVVRYTLCASISLQLNHYGCVPRIDLFITVLYLKVRTLLFIFILLILILESNSRLCP